MSAILTSTKVLVLNKNWRPLATVTLQDAIIKLTSTYENGTPKARIIEPESYQTFTWADWSELKLQATDERIASANAFFKIPEVIVLTKYEKLPRPRAHFSRRTLYKRDRMTCMYCGLQPGSEELTIDHVKPKSHGGLTTWENCVIACVDCNRKKANRTPQQAGMELRTVPKKPSADFFRFDTLRPVKSWEQFLGTAFWNVELENDNK
jgi:5-methylcytosine-specific restriction endonuclease McrA